MDFKMTNNINLFAESYYRMPGLYLLTPSLLLFTSLY